MTVYDYICNILIGKQCIYDDRIHTIDKMRVVSCGYGGTRWEVLIRDDDGTEWIDMSTAQIENAVEKSL